MRLALLAAWLLGVALFAALIAWQGAAEVGAVLALAHGGLLWIMVAHLGTLLADSEGWRALLPGIALRQLPRLAAWRWIGMAINATMPVAQIGGEVVRARLLARAPQPPDTPPVPAASAAASVLVDITLGLVTLILFAVIGVVLLLHRLGNGGTSADELLLALGVLGLALLGFMLAQRQGLFHGLAQRLRRLGGGGAWLDFTASAGALDAEIRRRYAAPVRLLQGAAWRLAAWAMGALEIWLIFAALGQPLSLSEVVILESLGQVARSAGFALPGGLGVQEGGMLAAAAWLAIGPELVLAAALIRRGRELAFGIGGLLAWPLAERRNGSH